MFTILSDPFQILKKSYHRFMHVYYYHLYKDCYDPTFKDKFYMKYEYHEKKIIS